MDIGVTKKYSRSSIGKSENKLGAKVFKEWGEEKWSGVAIGVVTKSDGLSFRTQGFFEGRIAWKQ